MLILPKHSIDKKKVFFSLFYQMPVQFLKMAILKTQFLKSYLLKSNSQTGPKTEQEFQQMGPFLERFTLTNLMTYPWPIKSRGNLIAMGKKYFLLCTWISSTMPLFYNDKKKQLETNNNNNNNYYYYYYYHFSCKCTSTDQLTSSKFVGGFKWINDNI
jgi:hypothetical protein